MDESLDSARHLADSIRALSRSFQTMADDHRAIELGKSDVLLFRHLKDKLSNLETALTGVARGARVEREGSEAALRSEKEKFKAKAARLGEEREDFETWRSRLRDELEAEKNVLRKQAEQERIELREEFERVKAEAVERAEVEVRELRADKGRSYEDLRERAHRENSALRGQLSLKEDHLESLRAEASKIEASLDERARLLRDEKTAAETELAELKPELAGSLARMNAVQEGADREIESLKADSARSEARMERLAADESEREAAAIEALETKVEEGSALSSGDPPPGGDLVSGGGPALSAAHPEKGGRSPDAIGVWAFGFSRQIRDNLGVIASAAKICIDRDKLNEAARGRLEKVLKNASEAATVVEEFLRLSLSVHPNLECGSVQELMAGLSESVLKKCDARKISLKKDFPPVLGEAMIDARRLKEGLLAVAENAVDAAPEGGALTLSARLTDNGEWFEISIRDDGAGMGAEVRAKACDPFFSTKKGRMGLGLCAARGSALAHGGSLEIESAPGQGTTVRVRIPAGCVPARRPDA